VIPCPNYKYTTVGVELSLQNKIRRFYGEGSHIHQSLNGSAGRVSLTILISICTIAFVTLSFFKFGEQFLLIDTAVLNSLGGLQTFPLIHAVSNAYHMWRFEPIAGLIAHSFGAEWTLWWMVASFAVGASFLTWVVLPRDSYRGIQSALTGVIVAALLVMMFGLDAVVWGSLAWLPLNFAVLLLGFERGFDLKLILALTCVSIFQVLAANQVALLFAIPMALYGWDRARYLNAKIKYQIILTLLIPATIVSVFMPSPDLERYALFSHFVPNYFKGEGRFGLIGADLDPYPVDLKGLRSILKLNLLYGGAAIFIVFLLKGFLGFKNTVGKLNLTKPLLIILFLFCSLIWSTLNDSDFAQISPISAANRLLPGLYLISLEPIIFAFAVAALLILVGIGLTNRHRSFYILALSAGVFYYAGASPIIWRDGADKFKNLILANKDPNIFLSHSDFKNTFDDLSVAKKTGIISPGLGVLLHKGLAVIEDYYKQKENKFNNLITLSPKLFASSNTSDLLNILDPEKATRSRVGKAPLKGDEWLLIELARPTSAQGIWIRAEEFYWDYARSVQILVAPECRGEEISKSGDFDGFREIFEDSSWEGYIHLSPKGVPFYGPGSEMKVFFKPQAQVGCILIRNRTPDSGYDWSVTDILLAPPQ